MSISSGGAGAGEAEYKGDLFIDYYGIILAWRYSLERVLPDEQQSLSIVNLISWHGRSKGKVPVLVVRTLQ